jgi:hypothetical protein
MQERRQFSLQVAAVNFWLGAAFVVVALVIVFFDLRKFEIFQRRHWREFLTEWPAFLVDLVYAVVASSGAALVARYLPINLPPWERSVISFLAIVLSAVAVKLLILSRRRARKATRQARRA